MKRVNVATLDMWDIDGNLCDTIATLSNIQKRYPDEKLIIDAEMDEGAYGRSERCVFHVFYREEKKKD